MGLDQPVLADCYERVEFGQPRSSRAQAVAVALRLTALSLAEARGAVPRVVAGSSEAR